MEIKILGTGCPKCTRLEANARAAAMELHIDIAIDKVSDINDILAYGVMMTPGLVIDGEVVSKGKVLTIEEIKKLIAERTE